MRLDLKILVETLIPLGIRNILFRCQRFRSLITKSCRLAARLPTAVEVTSASPATSKSRRIRESPDSNRKIFSGSDSVGETPVPIPNTAVKPYSADGTASVRGWESRTPPGVI